ncbi:MAG: superoxide dismutase [Anaerostipes sp.]|uniref:superoxide dismutase n=1 Tax=Anaerostipes sp. 992a TaxID=1261637 RepID=UPI000951342E|nr:superoxide dismutase [Anaerostipes sp. 992a]MCI5952250.1 superoxide dismutase [Anaerostipes sp.]MDD5968948.1 superoxide dismutase [Anaerostipes sp.]OLR65920.1 superoxide dismutase [Anaerostipes sp. 992a]
MNDHYPFVNTPLPYPYDALEPYIDQKTMKLHHDRHLQTYVDQLNAVLKDYPQLHQWTLHQLLTNIDYLPAEIQIPVRNNAGGVYSHRLYFCGMKKASIRSMNGNLERAMDYAYGGIHKFQEAMKEAGLSVFGSGYAWLVVNRSGQLTIMTTPNQDTPLSVGLCPIMNVDVWEHAYYLKNYNKRAEYIDHWLSVINWEEAEKNYQRCFEEE